MSGDLKGGEGERRDPLPRPYTIVNVAMSADGKISTRERRQVRISGDDDRRRVDDLKAGCDAIMVGIGTVLADNPSLTVKSGELRRQRASRGKAENPVRIVVDSRGRTPVDADILRKGGGERIIAVTRRAGEDASARYRGLAGVIASGEEQVDLPGLFSALHGRGIRRLMVEGGGSLIASLFAHGLVDEYHTYIGAKIIGGKDAPTPVDGRGFLHDNEFVLLSLMEVREMAEGVLLRWRVKSRE